MPKRSREPEISEQSKVSKEDLLPSDLPQESSDLNKTDKHEEADKADEPNDSITWVQCEACNKWRSWPGDKEVPDGEWHCKDNIYDPLRNHCEAEEEPQIDENDEENEDDEVDEESEALRREEIIRQWQVEQEKKAAKAEQRAAERAAERAALQEQRRKERLVLEEQKAMDLIASWTEEEREAKKKEALQLNHRKQLPIHLYTRQYGDKKATSLLMIDILLGADVNAMDYQGRTPLHYAVMNDCESYEKYLLDKGAEMWACDDSDRCPDEYRRFKQKKCMWDKFI